MSHAPFVASDHIDGVSVQRPTAHQDQRGWLVEFFRHDEMPRELHPAMGYVSVTLPGESRGPHEHREQSDTFCFAGPGTFRVVMWDNRESSPTFRHRMELVVGEGQPGVLSVPSGVVHAYRCISEVPGMVINVPNRLYCGPGKKAQVDEIRHEADPTSPFVIDFQKGR